MFNFFYFSWQIRIFHPRSIMMFFTLRLDLRLQRRLKQIFYLHNTRLIILLLKIGKIDEKRLWQYFLIYKILKCLALFFYLENFTVSADSFLVKLLMKLIGLNVSLNWICIIQLILQLKLIFLKKELFDMNLLSRKKSSTRIHFLNKSLQQEFTF